MNIKREQQSDNQGHGDLGGFAHEVLCCDHELIAERDGNNCFIEVRFLGIVVDVDVSPCLLMELGCMLRCS